MCPNDEPSRPPEGVAAGPSIEGFLDAVENDTIFGWAWNRGDPNQRLKVEVRDGNRALASIVADHPRSDLAANGIGDGRHAFTATVAGADELARRGRLRLLAETPDGGHTAPLPPRPEPSAAEAGVALMLDELRARDRDLRAEMQRVLAATRENHGVDAGALATIGEAVGRIAETQSGLERRLEAIDVFQVRFEELLNSYKERMSTVNADMRQQQQSWLILWAGGATVVALAEMLILMFG
jgi:hypothetical protein